MDKNKEIEEAVNQYLSEADFKIAKKILPDWERNYYWKYVEETSEEIYLDYCYMLYFPDSLSLKICQVFPVSSV